MSIEIDDRELRAVQQQVATAPARIQRRVAGRTLVATRALLKIARGVVHVRSSRLKDSLYVDGPYPVSDGLEAFVRSPVAYAAEEAARGGAHDYPTRTIQDGRGVLDELARDLEVIVIEEVGAGRS